MTDRDALLRDLIEGFERELREKPGINDWLFSREEFEGYVRVLRRALATPAPAAGEWIPSAGFTASPPICAGCGNPVAPPGSTTYSFQMIGNQVYCYGCSLPAGAATPTPAPSPVESKRSKDWLCSQPGCGLMHSEHRTAPTPVVEETEVEHDKLRDRPGGHSRLVYDKATRTIVKESATPPTALEGELRRLAREFNSPPATHKGHVTATLLHSAADEIARLEQQVADWQRDAIRWSEKFDVMRRQAEDAEAKLAALTSEDRHG